MIRWPWRDLTLDPQRGRLVRHDFEKVRGYGAWTEHCRQRMRRQVTSVDDELRLRGWERLTLLSEARAVEVMGWLLALPPSLSPVLPEILTPAVDARIVARFKSEYFIYGIQLLCTSPARRATRSLLWHCDRGPRDFLKLNLYLNATAKHGSTTEFVDREPSAAIEAIGYTFGPNRRRTADFDRVARAADIRAGSHWCDMKAGQAFLFEPSNVLHRGVPPTQATRYVLSLILLPSPVHWTEAWGRPDTRELAETSGGVFLSNAEPLYRMLG